LDLLQERLMASPLYETKDARVITQLELNYRSNSEIIRLPSKLFYGVEKKGERKLTLSLLWLFLLLGCFLSAQPPCVWFF
jgi:hypothetical protein